MKKIRIPSYNLCEELINSITHGIGVACSIAALVLCIVFSNKTIGVISGIIYGVTMIVMYLISTLYHALSPKLKAKKVFRVLDHCDIYIFIAGSYTPFTLSLIGGKLGVIMFITIWICAIAGVILNAINLEKYEKISMFLYLFMGWMIIFSFPRLREVLPSIGIALLLSGGIVYTIGAIIYGIGAKKRYFHSIFHFFVLGGSVLQFFSILFYAI